MTLLEPKLITVEQRLAELERLAARWDAKERQMRAEGRDDVADTARHWASNCRRVAEQIRKREAVEGVRVTG